MTRRSWGALAVAGVAWLGLPTAAAAIETATFGIEPAPVVVDGERRQSLHEEVPPGGSTTDAVRLWNKTGRPLTLSLKAVAAQRAADGSASLGGDPTPPGWVDVEQSRVTVPARGQRVVRFTIRAPRDLPEATSTFALLTEPVAERGEEPAVLQRLALMVYVRPGEGPASVAETALGLLPWVAAALLVLVLVGLVVVRRRGQAAATP